MAILWVIIIGIIIAIYIILKNKNKYTSQLDKNEHLTLETLKEETMKHISIKSNVWYMCIKNILPYTEGTVYLGVDIDPKIKNWFRYFREATEAEIEEQHPTPKPEPTPEPTPEPEPIKEIDYNVFNRVLDKFSSIIKFEKDSLTYNYLVKVYDEAYRQYHNSTKCTLPLLYNRINFPIVYDYWGDKVDEDSAFTTMVGWFVALHLSELYPQKRNYLFKTGYEVGGYTMNSNIYGYDFRSDPNVARLVASVIYVALRSILKPNTEAMRNEVRGKKYDKTLYELWDIEPRNHVTDDAFYIDLRKFMASAPGPYAPNYSNRTKNNPTFQDAKTSNKCLQMDMDIHNFVVKDENLPKQTSVQAIADKDWDTNHFFGSGKKDVHGYEFDAVFGEATIGEYITPNSKTADFINLIKQIGGSARGILQHADSSLGAIEYGRLRPGCSWECEGTKHSNSDNRQNILTDFWIEDGDGNPTGYYDKNGNWTQPSKVNSPKDYEEIQMRELYANSYPSGHSSGCWCAGMSLIEIYPYKADVIMREMNSFATNRTIARYHWTSDTIQGRVLGSAMNAVCHAAKDYDERIKLL